MFSVHYTEEAQEKGAGSMAERKRLGREHTCRCSSAHKMWAREEGKQNRKVGAEENSNGQKLLLLLKSVAELLRGLLEAKFSQRKRCRLLPVCIWNKQPSVQAWHVHPCWVSEQESAGISGEKTVMLLRLSWVRHNAKCKHPLGMAQPHKGHYFSVLR